MNRGAEVAVLSSLPVTAAYAGALNTALSLAAGLGGVLLARTVFVDRENRLLRRRQTLRETLPLTLVAMLIAGVVIVDNGFSLSKSAFTGLGVGWVAVLLLDVIGDRILAVLRPGVKITDMTGLDKVPQSMTDLIDLVDRSEADAAGTLRHGLGTGKTE